MAEIEFVQITWMRAFKVWWSLLWRGLLFGFLGGGLVGFILGFFMGLVKANPETIKSVCTIAGYIVTIPIGIAVTKLVLRNRYSDFKIALISNKK
jgi:ABC-type nitrate/sulfonate/bicarbonate transport system permease component